MESQREYIFIERERERERDDLGAQGKTVRERETDRDREIIYGHTEKADLGCVKGGERQRWGVDFRGTERERERELILAFRRENISSEMNLEDQYFWIEKIISRIQVFMSERLSKPFEERKTRIEREWECKTQGELSSIWRTVCGISLSGVTNGAWRKRRCAHFSFFFLPSFEFE